MHLPQWPLYLLCLQITRNQTGKQKDAIRVQCEAACIHVPVFQGQEMAITWQMYEVRAAVVHHGSQVQAGHFVAVLLGSHSAWVADDDNAPKPGSGLGQFEAERYLIWLTPRYSQRGTQMTTEAPHAQSRRDHIHLNEGSSSSNQWCEVIGAFF